MTADQAASSTSGFQVIDCDIVDEQNFYFLLREDYTQRKNWKESSSPPREVKLKKRTVHAALNPAGTSTWQHKDLKGFDRSIAGATSNPSPGFLTMQSFGEHFFQGFDESTLEPEFVTKFNGGILGGAITQARSFGEQLLCSTNGRQMLIRDGAGTWSHLGSKIRRKSERSVREEGFESFDAFSMSDIYTAGGEGDVWRYNGKRWKRVFFPSKEWITAVCCGGDGYVYIGVSGGGVYKGRKNKWKAIHKDDMTLSFKDMVWHEGKVWCTSDYGLWTIEGDTLTEASVDVDIKTCAGYLAAKDGVLLVAGYGGAAYNKDGEWHVLFHNSAA